jgi:LysM repeat protein/ABC-type branched-subunit amino acid transport system substrate-binding protein
MSLLPAFAQEQKSLKHEVKKGETIFSISKQYGIEQKDLVAANPDLIFGLKTGQELVIPITAIAPALPAASTEKQQKTVVQAPITSSAATTAALSTTPEAVTPTPKFEIYTVKRKDTLFDIARRYGIEVADIIEYNPEAELGIKRKQQLKIPDKDYLAEIRQMQMQTQTQPAVSQQTQTPEQTTADRYAGGFFDYQVQPGETFWRLETKYRISQSELTELNPSLKDGLKSGMKIRIPIKQIPDIQVFPLNDSEFYHYTVAQGETLYSLSKQYGVTVSELKRVNPVLEFRSLKWGEVILIPKRGDTSPQVRIVRSDEPACLPNPEAASKEYNIGLMLPLQAQSFASYDLDEEGDRTISPKTDNFMHFYEGVLLALDTMRHCGMNAKLHVFDTNQNKETVKKIVDSGQLNGLDLIIGPVYPELQTLVADFAIRNKIAMVSPLSADGTLENNHPYYFKVVPDRAYIIRKTAEYVADEYFDANIIILNTGSQTKDEKELAAQLRQKMAMAGQSDRIREYAYSPGNSSGLRNISRQDGENVFLITTETEADVSAAINSLNTLASSGYPVTLFSLSNMQRFRSIETEYFHQDKLSYLTPYYVNYQAGSVSSFIRKFRNTFAAEPNQYSFQGYDVALYFMTALYRFGAGFMDCLSSITAPATQLNIDFGKFAPAGGYVNGGLFVIQFQPDYNVSMKQTVGN